MHTRRFSKRRNLLAFTHLTYPAISSREDLLWCHEESCPNILVQIVDPRLLCLGTEPKVNDLEILDAVRIEELSLSVRPKTATHDDILRLDVPMQKIFLMDLRHSIQYALHNLRRFLLTEDRLGKFEHAAILTQLEVANPMFTLLDVLVMRIKDIILFYVFELLRCELHLLLPVRVLFATVLLMTSFLPIFGLVFLCLVTFMDPYRLGLACIVLQLGLAFLLD